MASRINRWAVGRTILGNYFRKLAARASATANISQGPRVRGRRYLFGLLLVFGIGLTLFAMLPDKLLAAIELAYYRGSATTNAVFLEWATVREVNVNGFEIMCKRIQDPDTTFHPIGSRIAMGSPTSGATYNFDITSGLIPNQQYCFRLREITSDNTPGEAFDLCGFGLGITPAPTPITVVVSIPITLTPTAVTVTEVPGLPAAPTLVPTIDPALLALTGTPTPTTDPFAVPSPPVVPTQPVSELPTPVPTATIMQQSVPQQPESPLTTPAVASQESAAGAAQAPVQEVLTEMPTETPKEFPTETPLTTDTPLPTETATQSSTLIVQPTATLTQTIPITIGASSNLVAGGFAAPIIPDNAAPAANVTATPLYVVVTATPTPLAALVVAPTFTPWPTAVPTQTFGVSSLLVPNTQNLMVGLLCLIFLSASGLGALGLVTSVLYMRSQTRRDRLPGPVYERRRY